MVREIAERHDVGVLVVLPFEERGNLLIRKVEKYGNLQVAHVRNGKWN